MGKVIVVSSEHFYLPINWAILPYYGTMKPNII